MLITPDTKNWLTGKDPDAGKDWRQEKKGTADDEIVGWHHLLDGHEFEHALGVGDGQGSLAYCSPWGRRESDTTEQLNWRSNDRELSLPSSQIFVYEPQVSWEKWLNQGMAQGIHKMNLEHLIVPESKEMI